MPKNAIVQSPGGQKSPKVGIESEVVILSPSENIIPTHIRTVIHIDVTQ